MQLRNSMRFSAQVDVAAASLEPSARTRPRLATVMPNLIARVLSRLAGPRMKIEVEALLGSA